MRLATDEEVASREAAEAGSASDNGRMISQAELQQALSRLGEAKRDLLLLCYHAELTGDQAAEILNIPIGTLKSRLHAARRALREQLVREAES